MARIKKSGSADHADKQKHPSNLFFICGHLRNLWTMYLCCLMPLVAILIRGHPRNPWFNSVFASHCRVMVSSRLRIARAVSIHAAKLL